jgi:hypothetical protein
MITLDHQIKTYKLQKMNNIMAEGNSPTKSPTKQSRGKTLKKSPKKSPSPS